MGDRAWSGLVALDNRLLTRAAQLPRVVARSTGLMFYDGGDLFGSFTGGTFTRRRIRFDTAGGQAFRH